METAQAPATSEEGPARVVYSLGEEENKKLQKAKVQLPEPDGDRDKKDKNKE